MSADVLVRAPIVLLPVLLFLAGLVQLDGYRLVRMRMRSFDEAPLIFST